MNYGGCKNSNTIKTPQNFSVGTLGDMAKVELTAGNAILSRRFGVVNVETELKKKAGTLFNVVIMPGFGATYLMKLGVEAVYESVYGCKRLSRMNHLLPSAVHPQPKRRG